MINIIVPVYNEARHIAENIASIKLTMLKFSNSQIIVVDDGSTDKTYDLLRAVKDIILLRHKINLGKGAAIRTGLERTQGEYIVFIDGDLDISSAQIRLLFDVLEVEQADVVIGSKLHSCSIVHYPVTRRILSLGYYWLIKFLFGLSCHDTQTGLKLFKSAALKTVSFETNGFLFDLELLVKLHKQGYKIAEAPVILETQTKYYSKKSRIGPRIVWRMLIETGRIWKKLKS